MSALQTSRLLTLAGATVLLLAVPDVYAIDLVVQASALVKALKAQLFKDRGRYYLMRPDRCNDPYLENPTVAFKQGRVYVGAHFAGRVGAFMGGTCRSVTAPGAIVLSARPALRAQEAMLDDVRLESADNPMAAIALQNLVGVDLLSPLRLNLLDAVRTLTEPERTAPYAVTARKLELGNLVVRDDELRVSVDGMIEVR